MSNLSAGGATEVGRVTNAEEESGIVVLSEAGAFLKNSGTEGFLTSQTLFGMTDLECGRFDRKNV